MREFPSEKELESLRQMYPAGTRIEVDSMGDPYNPIAPGTKGTVKFVDAAGTIHCNFDNGRRLGVIPGEDGFHKIGMVNASVTERYPLLIGFARCGNKRIHNIQEVAEFICEHGRYDDVCIRTEDGFAFLNTFGIYINKIWDVEYREELLKVLVPMQHEAENAAFSDDESMDETEDVDMTM